MAQVFRSIIGNVPATTTTILTATAGAKTVGFTSNITNKDPTQTQRIFSMTLQRGATTYYVFRDVPVPYGSAFDMGKLILEAGDILNIWCDAAGVLDYYISFVEMS